MPHERYGHYNELVEAGYDYLNGKISLGIFEETVNRIFSFIRDGEGQLRSLEFPEDLHDHLKSEYVKATEGFAYFEQGIDKIREFVEKKQREILWEGLSLAKRGCDLLNEVIQAQESRLDNPDESKSA